MWKFTFILTLCFYGIVKIDSVGNRTTDSADNILEFIRRAQIELENRYINEFDKNVGNNLNLMLVVGMTGAGKSTLVHYVAGDYSQMEAVDDEDDIELKIQDKLDRNFGMETAMSVSRTFVPEISFDEENYAWCDCPGFEDTHNETVEIATSVMIKRVIEKTSKIKIVVVVNSGSVTGNDRKDFNNVLTRVSELTENVGRLTDSISLVVTKTPSNVNEKRLWRSISKFINDHRQVLIDQGSSEKKIDIIDAIMRSSKAGKYPRISIFWRPEEPGPLSKIENMIVGRRTIRESIINNTVYTETQIGDFGFPLSEKAHLKVITITQQTNEHVSNLVGNITDQLLIEINDTIKSLNTFEEKSRFIVSAKQILQFNGDVSGITLSQFIKRMSQLIQTFNITSIKPNDIDRIFQYEQSLKTLNSIVKSSDMESMHSEASINTFKHFNRINAFLIDFENDTQADIEMEAENVIRTIFEILPSLDYELYNKMKVKLNTAIGFRGKLELLQLGKNCVQSFNEANPTLRQRYDELECFVDKFQITSISKNKLVEIMKQEDQLNMLNLWAHPKITFSIDHLNRQSSNLTHNLYKSPNSEFNWNNFLSQIFNSLLEYSRLNDPQKFDVEVTDFQEFLRYVPFSSELTPTEDRLKELNKMIKVIFEPVQYNCSDQTITMWGNFVKSCDVARHIKSNNACQAKKIVVHVSHTFYIDCDITINHIKDAELLIFAPTWRLLGMRKFKLIGIEGETQSPQTYTGTGAPGKPGNFGNNIGGFFGWANKVHNAASLTIYQSGGDGGTGQDGSGSADNNVVVFSPSSDYVKRITIDWNTYDYLKEFVGNKIGTRNFEFQEISESNAIGYYLVYAERFEYFKVKFRVYSECCSATGRGGPGGYGGKPGYFYFIQKAEDGNISHIVVEGKTGRSGKDGKICSSRALDIFADGEHAIRVYPFVPEHIIETKFKTKIVESPRCVTDYVENTMNIPTPNEVLELNVGLEMIKYRAFLRGNAQNPILSSNIQETYDALDSDPRIVRKTQ